MLAAQEETGDVAPGHEDQGRADLYALLARLLLAAPDDDLLGALARLDIPPFPSRPLDCAWATLAQAAQRISPGQVRDEYAALFTSIGNPLLNPFASLYIAGYINEKPLVRLRADLARLGLARRSGSYELEDHLGALCETMRILIEGAGRCAPQPLGVQHDFFCTHIAPWYERFLHDLRNAPGADFYRQVADLADVFLEIEAQSFEVADEEA
ncbi:molecular chaperone [Pseudoduganella sp. GCM10020061]|uniref:TorD/DmsD family molecular chaperone n=1 Tax=Pseudoduganella sp. GCM10020061 TaxID=3317345 RepID=UPI0036408881